MLQICLLYLRKQPVIPKIVIYIKDHGYYHFMA